MLLGFGVAVWLLYLPVFSSLTDQVVTGGPGRIQADTYLMLWVMSWGSRAASRPGEFFDANILHPAPSMLAGTEHMVGYLPIFAPVYHLTGNNVLAYQLTLFASLVLSAAALYALLRSWGSSTWGAGFAGFVLLANPGFYKGAAAVQMMGWFYFPIALFLFDRVLRRGRVFEAALLAAAVALQMLCSFYIAYMVVAFMAFYAAVVVAIDAATGRSSVRNVGLAGAGIAVAGLVFVVFALPYAARAAGGEIADQAARGVEWYSTLMSWQSYLQPPLLGQPIERSFYLGIAPFLLAGCAPLLVRDVKARVLGLWAGVLACVILAAGPNGTLSGLELPPLYDLFLAIPGFASIRGPNRFGLAVNFGVAALAGLGLSALLRRLAVSSRVTLSLVLALTVVTYVDFGIADFRHTVLEPRIGRKLPFIYRHLSRLEPGVLLELPGGMQRGLAQIVRESRYGFFSTFHWHRLLNGYTGYMPRSADDVMVVASALPDGRAIERLRRLTGLSYVAVHLDGLSEDAADRWAAAEGVELLKDFGPNRLYGVLSESSADLVERLITRSDPSTTFGGMRIAPVSPADRVAEVAYAPAGPERVVPRLVATVDVSVRNPSGATWPGQGPDSSGVVRWRARWVELATGRAEPEQVLDPLPYDVAPGEVVRTSLSLAGPPVEGFYRLEIGVGQGGVWFDGRAVAPRVEATATDWLKKRKSQT